MSLFNFRDSIDDVADIDNIIEDEETERGMKSICIGGLYIQSFWWGNIIYDGDVIKVEFYYFFLFISKIGDLTYDLDVFVCPLNLDLTYLIIFENRSDTSFLWIWFGWHAGFNTRIPLMIGVLHSSMNQFYAYISVLLLVVIFFYENL